MLDIFRNKKNSGLLIGILGVIVLGFVFFGIPTGGGAKNYVAMVDGEKISVNEYQKLYRQQVNYLKDQMGDRFSEDLLDKMGIRDRTVSMLINNILILKAANKDGMTVSDSEVQDIILNIPVFQDNGVFNKEKYFSVLQQNRMEVSEFESGVRQDLIMEKMREKVVSELEVTEEDAWKRFAADNRSVSFDYISAKPESFIADAEPDTEEVSKYFDEHGFTFTEPTKIKVYYAKLGIDDLAKEMVPSEDDLKNFYEEHKEDYFTPAKIRARHILVRNGKDKEQSRKKASGLLERVKAGEGFAKLAKEFSEDPGSAKKGGDLSYFTEGTMVKPFEDAAFSMAPGEVSGLVETVYGFHIIKVEDKKDSGYRPLKEVREDLTPKFARVEAGALAVGRAAELTVAFEAAGDADALKKAAEDAGFKFAEAGPFAEGDRDNEIALDDLARSAAFGLDAGGVSAPVEAKETVYLIKVTERVEEHIPPFEEVASKVTAAAKKAKSVKLASEAAEGLLKRLSEGATFEEEAKGESFESGATELAIKRSGYLRDLSLNVTGRDGFFDVTPEAPYFGEVVEDNSIFYVFKYKDFKDAERKAFDENKEAYMNMLAEEGKTEAMTDWIESLREGAELRVNQDLL